MKAVRITDERVVEVFPNSKAGLVGLYHPDFLAALVDAPDGVAVGWYRTAGNWSGEAPATPFAPISVKDECRSRIYAVANETAQMNMASFAAANLFTAEQMTAYTSGLQWVAAMRAQCAALIAAADPSFADDASWPACPPEAAALAAQF